MLMKTIIVRVLRSLAHVKQNSTGGLEPP